MFSKLLKVLHLCSKLPKNFYFRPPDPIAFVAAYLLKNKSQYETPSNSTPKTGQ